MTEQKEGWFEVETSYKGAKKELSYLVQTINTAVETGQTDISEHLFKSIAKTLESLNERLKVLEEKA